MSFIGVKSSRSFRQFRVAVFGEAMGASKEYPAHLLLGVTTFLRLAWAFILALNAFSLTTQTDYAHRRSPN